MTGIFWKCLGPSRTRAFTVLAVVFLVFYTTSNFEAIVRHPRHALYMIGSTAQFTFPLGVAMGTFLLASSRALGVADFEWRCVRRPMTVLFQSSAAATTPLILWIVVFEVVVAVINISMETRPQTPLVVLLYPIVALSLGTSVGCALGTLQAFIRAPRTLAIAYSISFVLGFCAFLLAVFATSSVADDPRYSFALPARVLEPSERLVEKIVVGHLGVMSGAALLLIVSLLVLRVRAPREMVVPALALAGAAALLASGIVVVGQSRTISEQRSQVEAECLRRHGVEVCFWREEVIAARRLADSLRRGYRHIPAEFRPGVVAQSGVSVPSRRKPVRVLQMPSDDQTAAIYAAELIPKQAGCSPSEVRASRPLARLIDFVYLQAAGRTEDDVPPAPDWLGQSLLMLKQCDVGA